MNSRATRALGVASATLAMVFVTSAAQAQSLHGAALVKALQQGGNVIVMRHASSPREAPDPQTANADNVNRERQLDPEGQVSAIAMGKALRDLKIPIGDVLSSPTYRALETVRYAKLGDAKTFADLGDLAVKVCRAERQRRPRGCGIE